MTAFFQAATGQVHVLGTDALCDLLNADTELRQFLLIYLDLDFVLEAATDLDGGRTLFGFEVILDAILGQPPQVFETAFAGDSGYAVRGFLQQTEPHDGFGRWIESQQQRPTGLQWQFDDVDFFTDIDTGNIHVSAPDKLERDVGLAGAGNGTYQPHVADDANSFLNRFRKKIFDLDRCCASQFGANRNRGVGNIRQQVHGQARQRYQAEQCDGDSAHQYRYTSFRGNFNQAAHVLSTLVRAIAQSGDVSLLAALSPVSRALITDTLVPSFRPA